ncbi:MAG: SMC-Scp complex subunit ScpB [Candidatus Syntropharchaeia archaeon]
MKEKNILEAALFVSGKPLSRNKLSELISKPLDYVEKLMEELMEEYEGRGIEIVHVDGKYVMQVRGEYAEKVRKLAPREIETQVLRTLSVIAFRQPITQSELASIRGNKAYSHVKELEERGLIKSEPKGHTKILRTTELFDAYFGMERKER